MNITDFGAVPGRDCTHAFLKAFEASLFYQKGTNLHIPGSSQPYQISEPLFLPPWLNLTGDGRDVSRVLALETQAYPAFYAGVPNLPTHSRALIQNFFDSSVRGPVYGFVSSPTVALQLDGGPAFGPYRLQWSRWADVSHLNISFALPSPPTPPGSPIFGFGRLNEGVSNPFGFVVHPSQPGWVRGYLKTSLAGPETDKADVCFDICSNPGDKHFTVDIDLQTFAFRAWSNRVQVPTRVYTPAPASPVTLCRNSTWPFVVASTGMGASLPATPLTIAGFHLSERQIFKYGDIGSPQAFLDGTPALGNDSRVYFTPNASTVFYFPFDAYDNMSRSPVVTVVDGRSYRWAALALAVPMQAVGRQSIRRLSVEGRGPGVLLGAVDNFVMEDVSVRADYAAAVGSVAGQISYPTRFQNCMFGMPESGAECGLQLTNHIVSIDNCRFEGYGDTALSLRGTTANVRNVFFGNTSPATRAAIEFLPYFGMNTPTWTVESATFDCENGPPRESAVTAWQTQDAGSYLRVNSLVTADLGGSPAVLFRPFPGAKKSSYYEVGGLFAAGSAVTPQGNPGWLAGEVPSSKNPEK